MNEPMELLSKADVMRVFKYPERQLDEDLKAGKLDYFTSQKWYGRHYITRSSVEARIRELTDAKRVQK